MTKSRSAVTGKYITKAKAKRNPKKTVTETITPYEKYKNEVMAFIRIMADAGNFTAAYLLKKLK